MDLASVKKHVPVGTPKTAHTVRVAPVLAADSSLTLAYECQTVNTGCSVRECLHLKLVAVVALVFLVVDTLCHNLTILSQNGNDRGCIYFAYVDWLALFYLNKVNCATRLLVERIEVKSRRRSNLLFRLALTLRLFHSLLCA